MKKFLLSIFAVMLAVFSVQAEEVTYTVNSVSKVSVDGAAPDGSTATYKSTYGTKCQLTKDNSMTLTLKGYAGCKITGISLSMKSNSKGGAGYFSAKVGTTTISSINTAKFNTSSWAGKWSTNYLNVIPVVTAYEVGNNEDIVIKITATENSLYCQSFTIIYVKEGSVAQPVFSKAGGEYSESFDLELTAANGNTVYYTLDGTEPNVNSTAYEKAIPVKASVLVKAIAVDSKGETSSVAQEEYVIFAPSTSGEYVKATSLSDWTGNYLLVCEEKNVAFNGGAASIDAQGNYISVVIANNTIQATEAVRAASFNISQVQGGYAVRSNSGYYIGRNESSNGMNYSNTTAYVNTISNGTIKGTGGPTLQYFSQSGSERFRYYASNQKPVVLYQYIAPESYVLNISKAGWATLYLDYNVVIPEEASCYVISEVGDEKVQLEEVTGILPAKTAVIVEAAEGEYTFEVAEAAGEVESIMAGTTTNKYIPEEAYVLGVVDGEVGLYKAEMAGGVWLNNANKAYLPASEVPTNVKSLSFRFPDTTGIENVESAEAVKAIFDLTGRRVEEVTAPGIYIVNGKKVLVK